VCDERPKNGTKNIKGESSRPFHMRGIIASIVFLILSYYLEQWFSTWVATLLEFRAVLEGLQLEMSKRQSFAC